MTANRPTAPLQESNRVPPWGVLWLGVAGLAAGTLIAVTQGITNSLLFLFLGAVGILVAVSRWLSRGNWPSSASDSSDNTAQLMLAAIVPFAGSAYAIYEGARRLSAGETVVAYFAFLLAAGAICLGAIPILYVVAKRRVAGGKTGRFTPKLFPGLTGETKQPPSK